MLAVHAVYAMNAIHASGSFMASQQQLAVAEVVRTLAVDRRRVLS